jgi:2-polyprenyl-6-hydroxyphenyl methylase/3-demethylubiquinone-9 3-methyltransferase
MTSVPPGIHDPALFVDRRRLLAAADRLGLDLRLVGLTPSLRDMVAWRLGRRTGVRMRRIPLTSVLFAGYGVKRATVRADGSAAHDPVRRHGSPSPHTVEP